MHPNVYVLENTEDANITNNTGKKERKKKEEEEGEKKKLSSSSDVTNWETSVV